MLAPLSALLLTLSLSAHAGFETTWDFRGGMPGRWEAGGWTDVESTPFGLRITTTRDGSMRRATDLTHPVQVVSLRVASTRPTEAILLWHVRGTKDGDMVQLPFQIPASETADPLDIDVSFYPQWDERADEIGLMLPAGSDVLLQAMTLRGWTGQERLWEGIKSFWHPDEFRPYSINFLWGPLIAFNPYQAATMFEYLPPRAMSAARWFYLLLAIAAGASLACRATGRRSAWLLSLPVAFAACWLVFDLRMGGEVLSYVHDDWSRYVLADDGDKELRTHGTFFGDLDRALPFLRRNELFAVMTDGASPAYQLSRYQAYPSVGTADAAMTGVTLWFIYDNPNVGVDERGRLLRALPDGSIRTIASSGRVVLELSEQSFLYELPR